MPVAKLSGSICEKKEKKIYRVSSSPAAIHSSYKTQAFSSSIPACIPRSLGVFPRTATVNIGTPTPASNFSTSSVSAQDSGKIHSSDLETLFGFYCGLILRPDPTPQSKHHHYFEFPTALIYCVSSASNSYPILSSYFPHFDNTQLTKKRKVNNKSEPP